MYPEDEMVMISALQHYLFCKRQCALIHIECLWRENYLTASGRILHQRVDQRKTEKRTGVRQVTGLRLFSEKLHLTGVADMVEFHQRTEVQDSNGATVAIRLNGASGFWAPVPVEYKRGTPKDHHADEIQLCAQALCLEEMLGIYIPEGALFYGEPHRRTQIVFDEELRQLTMQTAMEVASLIRSGKTPPAVYSKSCRACSLLDFCCPASVSSGKLVRKWIQNQIDEVLR
ncbi:MAG: CRISPR-associated protein Cas4 [Lentisphaeria bacterium]|nr:CRISPR-associated protein Cas4 [Lentisphaeria bacterium]